MQDFFSRRYLKYFHLTDNLESRTSSVKVEDKHGKIMLSKFAHGCITLENYAFKPDIRILTNHV